MLEDYLLDKGIMGKLTDEARFVGKLDINRLAAKLVAIAEKLAMMGSHIHSPEEIKAMIESNGVNARIISDNSFSTYIIAEK